ncbi:Uncharacterised protein [Mycobacteroides abscessus subsp. bolletii]|nr:Uncharacterised protein [Mycobacteroides abscessus subsp. bolletii]
MLEREVMQVLWRLTILSLHLGVPAGIPLSSLSLTGVVFVVSCHAPDVTITAVAPVFLESFGDHEGQWAQAQRI